MVLVRDSGFIRILRRFNSISVCFFGSQFGSGIRVKNGLISEIFLDLIQFRFSVNLGKNEN